MKTVNIGIIGLGTVGSGVVKTLIDKKKMLERKSGVSIRLAIVYDKDRKKASSLGLPKRMIAKKADEILNDRSIDIVCELIGGVSAAKKIILEAFKKRKHVITANKALLAQCGAEIFKAAKKYGCFLGFEASVCGAVPVIKVINESFAANRISALHGIVNGTCNFVLSKMAEENCSLNDAVRDAQRRGIAEADPSLDLDGIDSSHKLAILAMLCFGRLAGKNEIYVEGIRNIEYQDIAYAKTWGYDIKLLAIAKRRANAAELRVHPTLIPSRHLLSSVKYEDNAVFIRGDMIGESMLYGKGAGSLPAASSVLSDILDLSTHIRTTCSGAGFLADAPSQVKKIEKIDNLTTRYYVRFSAIDKPGVLAGISGILARNGISIATVSQKERRKGQVVPIVMLSHEAKESSMNKALKAIDRLGFIKRKSLKIRIEREL